MSPFRHFPFGVWILVPVTWKHCKDIVHDTNNSQLPSIVHYFLSLTYCFFFLRKIKTAALVQAREGQKTFGIQSNSVNHVCNEVVINLGLKVIWRNDLTECCTVGKFRKFLEAPEHVKGKDI